MECRELLTTYSSLLTLVIVGIGSLIFYFIRRYFEYESKKTEINHSLYQQNRLSAVNRFFESYAKAELMWDQIAIYDILSRNIPPKEIDQLVFPSLNELRKNLYELMIYFNESDHKKFKLILYNVESINRKMSELYFEDDPKITDINKSNEFQLIKMKAYQNCEKILIEICNIIKETFKT